MQEILLSLTRYEAIKNKHGVDAAVEAIRADIESHVSFPIQLELNGPNQFGDKVASLSFVRAASLGLETNIIHPNLLTCGFGANDTIAVSNLFNVLTNPHDLVVAIKQVHLEEDEVQEPKQSGLVVGAFAGAEAFVTYTPE